MKKLLFLGALLLSTVCMNAQTSEYYQEAANPIATNPALWAKVTAPQISWGSTDIRYKKEEPAPIHSAQKSMNLTAWKGEKISAQLVVWTPKVLNDLTFMVSDLTSGSATISKENIRTGFVRYVITDELNKDGLGACGYRNSADFDSTLVADVIDHITPTLTLPANSSQRRGEHQKEKRRSLGGPVHCRARSGDRQGHLQKRLGPDPGRGKGQIESGHRGNQKSGRH